MKEGVAIGCTGAMAAVAMTTAGLYPSIVEDLRTVRVLHKRAQATQEAMESLFIDKFETLAKTTPDKEFLIFEDAMFTYGVMDRLACQVAAVAVGWGLKPGDSVAIMMENEPAFVWTFLGLQKLGVAVSLVNHNLRLRPLVHSVKAVQPIKLIVGADKVLLDAVQAILQELKASQIEVWVQGLGFEPPPPGILSFDPVLTSAVPATVLPLVRRHVTLSDVCCFIYTSGTTGNPKPVRISQRRANALSVALTAVDLQASDRLYVVLPLYHTVAIGIGLLGAILAGATVVLRRKFSASQFWRDCCRYDVTVVQYIGELFRYLLAQTPSEDERCHSVRAAYGNGLRGDIWELVAQRYHIPRLVEFFGATEGTSIFINVNGKPGAVGRLSPLLALYNDDKALVRFDYGTASPLRDDNNRCMRVRTGEPGLFLAKVPATALTAGTYAMYHGAPAASDSKLVRDVFAPGDLWFNFGDVLVTDRDYWVYFHDRIGDTFRWKGENVSTTQVCDAMSALPFLYDVYVYGVEIPGHDGRAGMAALILNTDKSLSLAHLRSLYYHVTTGLPVYARPLFLRDMGQPAVTSTFKQRKVELVKEGFDLNLVTDPLYFMDIKNSTYTRLTADRLATLLTSKL